ncbi:hypothetical protein HY638_02405 [Candidatus Woesearchaeota archaeon]|nr:hypothetical protein [Candidatus Woesearchaeota archaeon]
MKRIMCLILVLLVLAGCAKEQKSNLRLPSESFVRQNIMPSPPFENLPQAKESDYDINDILFDDIIPGIGAGDKFGEGAWNNRVLISESTNSKVWSKRAKIIAEQASYPEAFVDNEGRLRVYFSDSKNKGTSVAIWHNSKWIYKHVGIEEGVSDTSITASGDGNYRMYYQIGNSIFSAKSRNGVYFERETGVRLSGNDIGGFDVFKIPSGWEIIVSEGGEFFASDSQDGLAFGNLEDISIHGFGGDVLSEGDSYRLFYEDDYAKQPAVFSASSKDGISWSRDSGVRLIGGSKLDKKGVFGPSVAKLDEKSYRMAYYSRIN